MAPYPRSDEFLRRLLVSRSEARLLNVETRVKLIEAGIPAERHLPCRCWTHAHRGGYGRMWNGLRLEDTHRISYRINVGPIPDGHDVLHRCDVTTCWEPSHLWTGTQADNNRDRDAKGRSGAHKLKGRKKGPSTQRGRMHKLAKLSEPQARRILRLSREGKFNASALARDLGVSESLVRGVISGRNWGWLASPRESP